LLSVLYMKNLLQLYPLIFLIVVFISCKNNSHDNDITIASIVTYTSGNVSISGSLYSLTQAKAGFPLNQGNTIITDEKSKSLFQMGDEAIIKLHENTSVSLMKISDKQRTLKINSGMIVGKVKKINKNDGFLIQLPDMIASVRGTDFMISIISNKTLIAVLNGKVALAPRESLLQTTDAQIIESGQTCTASVEAPGRLNKVISPSNAEEIRLLDTISNVPFITSAEKKSGRDLSSKMNNYAEKTPEPKPESPDIGQRKIIQMGRASILAIKEAFNRIDEITLYNNRIYSGIIISRGDIFDVITPDGRFRLNQKDIKATKVIR
jgi:hypothetical protein